MNKFYPLARSRGVAIFAMLVLTLIVARAARPVRAQADSALSETELVAQFRRVEVASVSDAIEQVLTNRSLREDLQYRARQRGKQFSWGDISRQTLEVIRNVAQGQPVGTRTENVPARTASR